MKQIAGEREKKITCRFGTDAIRAYQVVLQLGAMAVAGGVFVRDLLDENRVIHKLRRLRRYFFFGFLRFCRF